MPWDCRPAAPPIRSLLEYDGLSDRGDVYPGVIDVEPPPDVPEPGSLALTATDLAGLAGARCEGRRASLSAAVLGGEFSPERHQPR